MPASQLKRLKASLRDQGITGPRKSRKQKNKKNASGDNVDERARRSAALTQIRDDFNPFEFKHQTRPKKQTIVSAQSGNAKTVVGRPGVTKSHGEELVPTPCLSTCEAGCLLDFSAEGPCCPSCKDGKKSVAL